MESEPFVLEQAKELSPLRIDSASTETILITRQAAQAVQFETLEQASLLEGPRVQAALETKTHITPLIAPSAGEVITLESVSETTVPVIEKAKQSTVVRPLEASSSQEVQPLESVKELPIEKPATETAKAKIDFKQALTVTETTVLDFADQWESKKPETDKVKVSLDLKYPMVIASVASWQTPTEIHAAVETASAKLDSVLVPRQVAEILITSSHDAVPVLLEPIVPSSAKTSLQDGKPVATAAEVVVMEEPSLTAGPVSDSAKLSTVQRTNLPLEVSSPPFVSEGTIEMSPIESSSVQPMVHITPVAVTSMTADTIIQAAPEAAKTSVSLQPGKVIASVAQQDVFETASTVSGPTIDHAKSTSDVRESHALEVSSPPMAIESATKLESIASEKTSVDMVILLTEAPEVSQVVTYEKELPFKGPEVAVDKAQITMEEGKPVAEKSEIQSSEEPSFLVGPKSEAAEICTIRHLKEPIFIQPPPFILQDAKEASPIHLSPAPPSDTVFIAKEIAETTQILGYDKESLLSGPQIHSPLMSESTITPLLAPTIQETVAFIHESIVKGAEIIEPDAIIRSEQESVQERGLEVEKKYSILEGPPEKKFLESVSVQKPKLRASIDEDSDTSASFTLPSREASLEVEDVTWYYI